MLGCNSLRVKRVCWTLLAFLVFYGPNHTWMLTLIVEEGIEQHGSGHSAIWDTNAFMRIFWSFCICVPSESRIFHFCRYLLGNEYRYMYKYSLLSKRSWRRNRKLWNSFWPKFGSCGEWDLQKEALFSVLMICFIFSYFIALEISVPNLAMQFRLWDVVFTGVRA